MSEAKPKDIFAERDWLKAENARLERENADLRAGIQMLQQEQERHAKVVIENATLHRIAAGVPQTAARLAATEEVLRQVQRESAEMREWYEFHCGYLDEAHQKIVNAAVAEDIARNAEWRLDQIRGDGTILNHPELFILMDAEGAASVALREAVREYRALTEPPTLEQRIASKLERLEDEGALEGAR